MESCRVGGSRVEMGGRKQKEGRQMETEKGSQMKEGENKGAKGNECLCKCKEKKIPLYPDR